MSPDTVLIANRGEIACRVIRAVRSLGLRSVAVYSDADRDAPHVKLADQAVYLGPTHVAESYLNLDKLIDAAKQTQAGAIHPGYGFFSENPALPERCEAEGITWVGPSAEAIRLMGDKRAARLAVAERNVPCVPGYDGDDQSDERLLKEAERVGFPLMVKASMGGGGKGMRLVESLDQVAQSLEAARREAAAAFGDGSLILERAIIHPKHIEVQVFGDQNGDVVHLGERECSLQRRHQKVIEEAPSPAIDAQLRAAMGKAAIEVARAVDYVGAGTVEFLLDASGAFYFLEMNTRIQVEHPVTEAVYGVDLVAWQIKVARGESLPLSQEAIDERLSGHAIEARIYAEDPAQNFMPQAGPVLLWQPAQGEGIRVDAGVGSEVSSAYDPMLAKIIAHGPTRETARRRLLKALDDSLFFGPNHNIAFLKGLLQEAIFIDGSAHTRSIDETLQPTERKQPQAWLQGLAAVLLSTPAKANSGLIDGWGSTQRGHWPVRLELDLEGFEAPDPEAANETAQCWQVTQLASDRFRAVLTADPLGLADHDGDEPLSYEFDHVEVDPVAHTCRYTLGGINQRQGVLLERSQGQPKRVCLLSPEGHQLRFSDTTYTLSASLDSDEADHRVRAPMSAKVVKVLCEQGQQVAQGDTLLILEAMKLEHRILAPMDGVIAELTANEGDQVSPKQQLAELAAGADSTASAEH